MNENKLKVNKSHIKLLDTIKYFNDLSLYVSSECIFNILKGNEYEVDDICKSCPTYMNLISITSRKLKSKINMLHRYNYIKYIFSKNINEPFFMLTDMGKKFLIDYHKLHKTNYKKRKIIKDKINYIKNNDPSIIKL